MKRKIDTIPRKITLLNETILESMTEKDSNAIVKYFTEGGIQILEADFGFAWWKSKDSDEYKLAYKSPGTPYEPFLPRSKASHYKAIKSKKPLFDSNVKKENYGESDISPYMKSFIIIPIYHDHHIYGSITLCYKKKHDFTEEELTLAQAIGHTTAQAITIHRFIEKEKETEIFAKKAEEEKLKTEFIANATHELRTPLAIMKGSVDLALMNKKVDVKSARETLEEINFEISVLSNILKDLALLTSPNSAGQYERHIENSTRVDITKLIASLVKRLEIPATKKNIAIKIKNKKGSDIFVAGDERHLEKLFINLIKNAITYGKNNGNIVIDLATEKNTTKIKISDDGIGISKEDLPKIFDRFYRGDKAHTHDSPENHSGLGLAIAKWTAEIHGGTIEAQSVYNQGSTFIVTLPRLVN